MTARRARGGPTRPPIEAALRHLGARRHGNLVELIEYAIKRPDGQDGTILASLTASTSVLDGWTPQERARALWKVIEEGIVDPQVSSAADPRRRRVLQAAFRIPDEEVGEEWRASLTERFKQLKVLRSVFGEATSTQPMEIAWRWGVERLSERVAERLDELRTPQDWAAYKPVESPTPDSADITGDWYSPANDSSMFRPPSEGAQKLLVNFCVVTVVMQGRGPIRRISERIITAQEDGLQYYTTHAFSSESMIWRRSYVPTRALWGCRAEQLTVNGRQVTRLWLPRPLKAGEQAHFMSEAVYEPDEDDLLGWANVEVDHYGIEPGVSYGGVLPVRGLTIRISFDKSSLPTAVWSYAEQNEQERYLKPPTDSPRLLSLSGGDVVKTFEKPCNPRENYGIAYEWATDETAGSESARPTFL